MAEPRDGTPGNGKSSEDPMVGALGSLGGLTDGLANLLGKLGELAEKGEQLKRSGEFQSTSGKGMKGSYGFSMRFGAGDDGKSVTKVEPFQKQGTASAPSKPKVEDREPQVDLFSEAEHLLIIAEMPGIAREGIQLDFSGNTLTLSGSSPRVRFSKQIELPREVAQEEVELSINNGVVEVRLKILDSAE